TAARCAEPPSRNPWARRRYAEAGTLHNWSWSLAALWTAIIRPARERRLRARRAARRGAGRRHVPGPRPGLVRPRELRSQDPRRGRRGVVADAPPGHRLLPVPPSQDRAQAPRRLDPYHPRLQLRSPPARVLSD